MSGPRGRSSETTRRSRCNSASSIATACNVALPRSEMNSQTLRHPGGSAIGSCLALRPQSREAGGRQCCRNHLDNGPSEPSIAARVHQLKTQGSGWVRRNPGNIGPRVPRFPLLDRHTACMRTDLSYCVVYRETSSTKGYDDAGWRQNWPVGARFENRTRSGLLWWKHGSRVGNGGRPRSSGRLGPRRRWTWPGRPRVAQPVPRHGADRLAACRGGAAGFRPTGGPNVDSCSGRHGGSHTGCRSCRLGGVGRTVVAPAAGGRLDARLAASPR
jgi:hypothetical protein